jgi:hypothetical protein
MTKVRARRLTVFGFFFPSFFPERKDTLSKTRFRFRFRFRSRGCDYTLNETIASERFIPTVARKGDTRSGDDTTHHQSMSLVRATKKRSTFFCFRSPPSRDEKADETLFVL